MHIYRHDSGRGVSDLLEFNGITWDIFCLNRRSPDSHLCDSGLCTLRISEGKSKGVQESGLHHKNNKFLLFIDVCSLCFLSLFLEWLVQQLLVGIIKLGSSRDVLMTTPLRNLLFHISIIMRTFSFILCQLWYLKPTVFHIMEECLSYSHNSPMPISQVQLQKILSL